MISIVLPVFNEELILRQNTQKVLDFCKDNIQQNWQIIISDNNSTDQTATIAKSLSFKYPEIKYIYTDKQGKGLGVINAWQKFPSDIYIFLDADLSTDLKSLPELIKNIELGYDIVLGSRFHKKSKVNRTIDRRFFSNILHLILKLFFNIKIKDTPCGFKAINQKVMNNVISEIKNKTWFFDTEMVVLAAKQKYKIKEIPIAWQENNSSSRKSKVKIIDTIKDYLQNIFSLYHRIN